MAGIIDEEFFPGPVFLAETDIQGFSPLAMEFTELTVWVSVGVGLFIFVPKEHQGYAFLFAFLVKRLHGGHLAFFWKNGRHGRKEPVLQGGGINRNRWPEGVGLRIIHTERRKIKAIDGKKSALCVLRVKNDIVMPGG